MNSSYFLIFRQETTILNLKIKPILSEGKFNVYEDLFWVKFYISKHVLQLNRKYISVFEVIFITFLSNAYIKNAIVGVLN